jgi:hypothetical protein
MSTRLLIYAHAFAPKIGGVESAVMSLAMGVAKSQAGSSDSRVTVVTPPRAATSMMHRFPLTLCASQALHG